MRFSEIPEAHSDLPARHIHDSDQNGLVVDGEGQKFPRPFHISCLATVFVDLWC